MNYVFFLPVAFAFPIVFICVLCFVLLLSFFNARVLLTVDNTDVVSSNISYTIYMCKKYVG